MLILVKMEIDFMGKKWIEVLVMEALYLFKEKRANIKLFFVNEFFISHKEDSCGDFISLVDDNGNPITAEAVLYGRWYVDRKPREKKTKMKRYFEIFYEIHGAFPGKLFEYRLLNNLSCKQLSQIFKKAGVRISPLKILKIESKMYSPTLCELWDMCYILGWNLNITIDTKPPILLENK